MSTIQQIENSNIITFNGDVFDTNYMTPKQIESLELQIAVSKFVDSGNQIEKLEQGYTVYPDGKLPPIQNQKARAIAPSISSNKTKHIVQDIDRQEAIEQAKVRASKIQEKSPKQIKAKKPINHLSREELERRTIVRNAHREAVLKGLTEFEAPCAVHGNTTFAIYAECRKCKKCAAERREKAKAPAADPTRAQRSKIIAERRKEAEEKGLKEFIGVCRIHKETLYKIQINGSRCHECSLERSEKDRNSKKTPEAILDSQRKARNKVRIESAIKSNTYEFLAECKHCDETMFRLKAVTGSTDPNKRYAFCIACSKKYQ